MTQVVAADTRRARQSEESVRQPVVVRPALMEGSPGQSPLIWRTAQPSLSKLAQPWIGSNASCARPDIPKNILCDGLHHGFQA